MFQLFQVETGLARGTRCRSGPVIHGPLPPMAQTLNSTAGATESALHSAGLKPNAAQARWGAFRGAFEQLPGGGLHAPGFRWNCIGSFTPSASGEEFRNLVPVMSVGVIQRRVAPSINGIDLIAMVKKKPDDLHVPLCRPRGATRFCCRSRQLRAGCPGRPTFGSLPDRPNSQPK